MVENVHGLNLTEHLVVRFLSQDFDIVSDSLMDAVELFYNGQAQI